MSALAFQQTEPVEHSRACRRGSDPALPFNALDCDRCLRCAALRVVLAEVHRKQMERLKR